MKIAKKKRAFMDGYKTYDPAAKGFGTVADWGRRFKDRLNLDEAVAVLDADSPLGILGFTEMPAMQALKDAFKKLIRKYHPDNGESADAEKATKIIAAYTVLKDKLEK